VSGDDIVKRLREYASVVQRDYYDDDDLPKQAADEIERLQRWRAESITLLKQWNQIADDVIARLDADDTLGLRLPDIVASELARLRAERDASRLIISDLTVEVERLRAEVAVLRDELRLAGEEARRG
jgi:hypothetical protein